MARNTIVEKVEKKWLSAKEAMSYLDCSSNYLQSLRDTDQIRFSIVGRKYFYLLQSIDLLLERNMI